MNFQFLPGIAGIPYPPMMMNGPHYHPPVSVTVNSIPNPNPRSTMNPFEIEQANLQNTLTSLADISNQLGNVNEQVKGMGSKMTMELDSKFNRILQMANWEFLKPNWTRNKKIR